MFISFIIPLYNCEQYVERCLDSIADAQLNPNDYEIVVVNDGSTDHGPEICSKYSKFKIKLFHQINSGQATARNLGLSKAKGDYVWFVDADDTIIPEIVGKLHNEVKKNNSWDMVSFNYQMEYGDHIENVSLADNRVVFDRGIDYLKRFRGGSYLWNKLFNRQSLSRPFLDGTSHIEDMCFNVQNIISFKKILFINTYGYLYNRTNVISTSHSHGKEATKKANEDAYRVYTSLYQDMISWKKDEVKSYLYNTLYFGVSGHLYTMVKESSYDDIQDYIERYKKLGLYPIKKTPSRKANYFAFFANRKWFLFILYKLYHLTH